MTVAVNQTVDTETLYRKVGYHPHEKQQMFHDSEARFKVPSCGRRFGKSMMAAMELLPQMFIPDTRYWIVGPTYDLGEKEFRYLWDAIVIRLGLGPKIKRKAYNLKTGDMYIEMPWKTRVDVRSADHPDSLVGEGLNGLIVSEAAKNKRQTWEKYLRPSLSDYKGWAIFPSTPEGFNWYYDIYILGQDEDYTEWESWNFPSWENPFVYPEGFEDPEIKGQMGTEEGSAWFWQEIGADFRTFVGKIYTDWVDADNIIWGDYEYNPAWPNYLFYDPGYANPFAALDVQVGPDDTLYVWREYYETDRSNHKNILELSQRPNPPGYQIRCAFGDAADPGTVDLMNSMLCPTIANPDSKDILRGIQEVKRLMQKDDQGKTHIMVHKSCKNTIFEVQNYRIIQNAKDDMNVKEEPKKFADHAMDALRYGIVHLYVLGSRYHLDDTYVQPTRLITDDPPELELEEGESGHTFFELGDDVDLRRAQGRSIFTMSPSGEEVF